MNISEHFTLEELSFSEAAARLGLDNTPIPIVVTNLGLVAAVMERTTYPRVRMGTRWLGARRIVIPPGSPDEALARGSI